MTKLAKLLFVLLFLSASSANQKCFGQDSFGLDYIDSYPVKVDGESSYFTYDTTSLAKGKFVFVVSGSRTAFFKTDGKIVIVSGLKRQAKQNGYTDRFEGSGYYITLDVSKGKKISESQTNYVGELKISQGNKVKTIKINGVNEEYELNK